MTVDFRAFLRPQDPGDPVVLPYVGGTRVFARAPDRPLRVALGLAPGWWSFRIDGRRAEPIAPAPPPDLGALGLPAVRGHWAGGWLFSTGRDVARIALPPPEEPAPLARCTARRWWSGDLLVDTIDFEDDAEVEARRALDDLAPLPAVAGVAPSLRAAYAYALAAAVARRRGVPVSPREVARAIHAIADRGGAAADELVDALVAERAAQRALGVAREVRARRRSGDPVERADAALTQAGARLLGARALADGELECRIEVDGERVTTVVDADTLQVYDAGVCLLGADRELTLDSLPSVIREAIELDALNITNPG